MIIIAVNEEHGAAPGRDAIRFEFIERNRLVMEGRSVRLGTVLRDRKPAVRLNGISKAFFLTSDNVFGNQG